MTYKPLAFIAMILSLATGESADVHAACSPLTACPNVSYNSVTANTLTANTFNIGTFTFANLSLTGNLSVSGSVSGAGFTAFMTSPPPLGNVTPNTGAFTNLSASGTVSGSGFTNLVTSQFASPPPIGNVTPNTGAFTRLSAIGALTQTVNNVWSGPAYPPVANGGFNFSQQFSGSPTTPGLEDTGGNSLAMNSIVIPSDQLNWTNGPVNGLELFHYYGGGAASGGRDSMYIDSRLNGAFAAGSGNFFSALQIYQSASANVTGATSGSGNGKGTFFGISFTAGQIGSGVHAYQLTGAEFAMAPQTGSTAQYSIALNLINQASPGWSSYGGDYAVSLSTSNGALWNYGIAFSNPNGSDAATFPIAPTGTAIKLGTGTLDTGIDGSNLTATTAFIKGPGSFLINGSGNLSANLVASSGGYQQNGSIILFQKTSSTGVGPGSVFSSQTSGRNNIAIGVSLGNTITTSFDNVLIGDTAGVSITDCSAGLGNGFDTAIGFQALQHDNGCENTAVGSNALSQNTSGTFNVGLGNDALLQNTTGTGNIGIGHAAGGGQGAALTGGANVSVGNQAANFLAGAANSNVYVGGNAGSGSSGTNNTGNSNVGIGWEALFNNGNAGGNTAVGFAAIQGNSGAPNTSIGQNTAIGFEAGQLIQGTGVANTLIGYVAGAKITTGISNVIVGSNAGQNATGSSNTILGFAAGATLTSGTNNILIGPTVASTTLTTGVFNIVIGGSSACDTATSGTNNSLAICGSGAPFISATGTNTPSTSAIVLAGTLSVTGAYLSGASVGLTCSGTPSSSFTSTLGIVPHC